MTNIANTQNSQQNQLLQQLRDIHTPAGVDWWPLAPGWWVIIGLVSLITILLIVKYLLKKHHYRYSRFAIAELETLKKSGDPRWLANAQNIMRRLSLCYLPREEVSHLSQGEWLEILKATNNGSISQKNLEAFVDLPYKPAAATESLNRKELLSEIISWAAELPEQSKGWSHQSKEPSHV